MVELFHYPTTVMSIEDWRRHREEKRTVLGMKAPDAKAGWPKKYIGY